MFVKALTPNIALKSGSLKRKGILLTCSRLGWPLRSAPCVCVAGVTAPEVTGTRAPASTLPSELASLVPAVEVGCCPPPLAAAAAAAATAA